MQADKRPNPRIWSAFLIYFFYRFDKFRRVPIVENGPHGGTIWRKDSNFHIENHVKEHPVEAENETRLKEIIQENLIPTFPSEASPWTILLINTREGNTVLLVVIHHSITDGVGSMNLFNQLLTDIPGNIPQRKTVSKTAPLSMYRNWACTFLDFAKLFLADTAWVKDATATKSRLAWNKSIKMVELSVVRKKLGLTINSIICGVISEAISRYMALKGIPTPDKNLKVELPVSMRIKSDYMPGNRVGIILAEIPLSRSPTIQERVQYFAAAVNRQKPSFSSLSALIGEQLMSIASVHHGVLSGFQRLLYDGTASSISNIAGPQGSVRMAERDVRRMIFIPCALYKSGKYEALC